MMIDLEDQRARKALVLAADAGQWLRVRTKTGEPLAFAVPSQRRPGVYYLATTTRCQCVDFQRRQQPCKHALAVALYVALRSSSQQSKRCPSAATSPR